MKERYDIKSPREWKEVLQTTTEMFVSGHGLSVTPFRKPILAPPELMQAHIRKGKLWPVNVLYILAHDVTGETQRGGFVRILDREYSGLAKKLVSQLQNVTGRDYSTFDPYPAVREVLF